jgi:hypothetical protein
MVLVITNVGSSGGQVGVAAVAVAVAVADVAVAAAFGCNRTLPVGRCCREGAPS